MKDPIDVAALALLAPLVDELRAGTLAVTKLEAVDDDGVCSLRLSWKLPADVQEPAPAPQPGPPRCAYCGGPLADLIDELRCPRCG